MKLKSTLLIATTILLFACKKDKNDVEQPTVINEEEVITTLKVKMISATDTLVYQFSDPDGDGGASGVSDNLRIDSNTVYKVELQFLNRSNPSKEVDITTEIKEEAVDHLVCFETNSNIAVVRTDKDANNRELGINSTWTVGSAGKGSITIRLRH